MTLYTETCGTDFNFWSGAKDTVKYLDNSEIEQITEMLEDCYPEGMTDTEFNDFFWFEDDTIAQWLGWNDFKTLMDGKSKGFESQEDYDLSLDEDEE